MVVPTRVRAGLVTALFAAFQSAKGTAVTDFTAASAKALWAATAEIPVGKEILSEPWGNEAAGPPFAGLSLRPDKPGGMIPLHATPTSVEWLLKSNYGSYSSPNFTLASQVAADRYMTLGWVESSVAGSVENLVRLRDAWFHRLDFMAAGPMGRLWIMGHFAARIPLIQALNAGGVTLPAAPMSPADKSAFPAASIEVRRDPSGANVNLRWRHVRLTFLNKLAQEWDPAAFSCDVYKAGKLTAELEFTSDWSDETWAVVTNARAKTAQTYRFKATAEDGSILTVDLHNVIMKTDPPGREGLEYRPFRADGKATVSGSNFVSVSLT